MLKQCLCFSHQLRMQGCSLVVFAQSYCKALLSTAWNSVTAALPASLEEMVPVLTKIDEIAVSDLSYVTKLFHTSHILCNFAISTHLCKKWIRISTFVQCLNLQAYLAKGPSIGSTFKWCSWPVYWSVLGFWNNSAALHP